MPRFKCSVCGKEFDMGAFVMMIRGKNVTMCPDCHERYEILNEELEERVLEATLKGENDKILEIIDKFIEEKKDELEKLKIPVRFYRLQQLRRFAPRTGRYPPQPMTF